jgi:hypothetical protein
MSATAPSAFPLAHHLVPGLALSGPASSVFGLFAVLVSLVVAWAVQREWAVQMGDGEKG